jgi:hypothetical protein
MVDQLERRQENHVQRIAANRSIDESMRRRRMKVKDAIEKLKQFDPELPFVVADWQEGYMAPDEAAAENISEGGGYYPVCNGGVGSPIKGRCVVIG